jgi:hypothetical protein
MALDAKYGDDLARINPPSHDGFGWNKDKLLGS